MFSIGAGIPGTFQGIFAFQHRQASLRCCMMVLFLFALTPSGIISLILIITAERSSKSKLDSSRCLVTYLDAPLECLPSNCLASRFPNQRSSKGIIPLRKNNQTLHIGAQNPHPGPFPTGPVLNR